MILKGKQYSYLEVIVSELGLSKTNGDSQVGFPCHLALTWLPQVLREYIPVFSENTNSF